MASRRGKEDIEKGITAKSKGGTTYKRGQKYKNNITFAKPSEITLWRTIWIFD